MRERCVISASLYAVAPFTLRVRVSPRASGRFVRFVERVMLPLHPGLGSSGKVTLIWVLARQGNQGYLSDDDTSSK